MTTGNVAYLRQLLRAEKKPLTAYIILTDDAHQVRVLECENYLSVQDPVTLLCLVLGPLPYSNPSRTPKP